MKYILGQMTASELKAKLAAAKELFGAEFEVEILVHGTWRDKDGELFFANGHDSKVVGVGRKYFELSWRAWNPDAQRYERTTDLFEPFDEGAKFELSVPYLV